ncbi:ureidoglycolate lyase [Pseudomonas oryzihabitans]|uniref:Ureidoglycolate lyase n=1 Tax=Pseudomonas oryzihabitans TaxID=47885 RepID=A0AAJ2BNM8_9PSED|nr:ureidoglycolate lyase [Pseudomonas psychrotolerans]MDR6236405.1 ureidoglycolate lyase [Pseudomonas psychrotolerans]MDR6354225.1 ureidoglycolate lyase [Pseudomonas psychrotolerans]
MSRQLVIEPLTAEGFAPFGDVIETEGRDWFPINNGSTQRFHALARVETGPADGAAIISIFRARRLEYPLTIAMLERHPHGSQAFVPLRGEPFLVVVAPPAPQPDAQAIRVFRTDGRQGINYHAGVWHHPVLALRDEDEFLIVDRCGELPNCDEHFFAADETSTLAL